MKKSKFENKYKSSNIAKMFFANVVCFLLVSIVSFAFCYAYFSDKVDAEGSTSTALISIEYCKDANTSIDNVYAQLNGDTATTLTGISVLPGDEITIKGIAVNTSKVNIYVLGRLEVVNKDYNGDIIDTEVVWYNIQNNNPLYVQRGLFQVGASTMVAGTTQELNITYEIEGDRYTNDYADVDLTFSLYSHQKDYLNTADDYNNYTSVNGYSQDSIYATHYMTGRLRDVWDASDADIDGLTINNLRRDSSGAYLINSCRDWMIIKNTSTVDNTYYDGYTFKLNAYLDFDNYDGDKSMETFYGDLDGQGYTICNWRGNIGLFGKVFGNISNLGIDGIEITRKMIEDSEAIGCLARYVFYSDISNCYVIGASVYNVDIEYDMNITCGNTDHRIGGLVGNLRGDGSSNGISSSIENCYVILNILVSGNESVGRAGGICGMLYPEISQINNCYYQGDTNVSFESGGYGLIAGITSDSCVINECVGITNSANAGIIGEKINCAYINNTGLTSTDADYNKVIKTGDNQTDKVVTIDTFKSSGAMRDAFGWDTSIWSTNIYNNTNTNGLLVLRVFYNF